MTRSTFFDNSESSGNASKKIKNRINAVESTIDGTNETVSDLSTNYYAYKASNDAALATTTGTVSSNTGDISTLTSGLAAAVGDITTNTASVATNTSNLSTLTADIASAEATIAAVVVTVTGKQDLITSSTELDIGAIDGTLLKNITLGPNWKYQNSASYSVRNATTTGILEQINTTNGQHNWYAAGNTAVVMAWQAQNDRLFLSGDVLANNFLHTVSNNNVVRGFGFFRFEGTSGSVDMNTTAGADVPWTTKHVDGFSCTT